MNKRLKAAIAGLAFVAGCEVGIALQLAKMIRDYALKEKALSEPLEVSEEEIAAEQAINEELDTAADTEEICEEDTSVEDQNTVTREQKAQPSQTERRTPYGIQDHRRFKL